MSVYVLTCQIRPRHARNHDGPTVTGDRAEVHAALAALVALHDHAGLDPQRVASDVIAQAEARHPRDPRWPGRYVGKGLRAFVQIRT